MLRFLLAVIALSFIGLVGCEPAPSSDDAPESPKPTEETPAVNTSVSFPEPDSLTAAHFDAVMDQARTDELHTAPIGTIVQTVGQFFLGAPYLDHTLDTTPNERLVTRLDGFDCVTFVEATLALSRGISHQAYDFQQFATHLQEQRYRGDAAPSYCKRLHYFSEWIADNHKRGVIEDITADLGGEQVDRPLTFMSEHRDAYERFAENDSLYACIQDMEASLQAQDHHWHIIPQDAVGNIADQIEAGDIIGLATDIDGLDIAHTGLAFRDADGALGLLHASLSGEVLVSPDLQQYLQQIDHQIGIVVARPVAP